MDYFDQISNGARENVITLLRDSSETLDTEAKKAMFKRNVEIVNLELSYQCNRKCSYCPVRDSSRQHQQAEISTDLLVKTCQELALIRYENRISLNLYNEPLLDSNLEDKISLIRQHLPYAHIGFNSNGDLLDSKRVSSLSSAGCDLVRVTLHPLPNKPQTRSNVERLMRSLLRRLDVSIS